MAIKINGNTVIYDDEVLRISASTTENRPNTPVIGMLRYNTTENTFEGYNGFGWGPIGGGAVNKIFWENDRTVADSYTLTTGKNAGTFGPVTINNGVVVTIPTDSTWSIV